MKKDSTETQLDIQSVRKSVNPSDADLTGASAIKLMEAGDVEFAEKRLKTAIAFYLKAFSESTPSLDPGMYIGLASRVINCYSVSGRIADACELVNKCLTELAKSEIDENKLFSLYTICGNAFSMHGEKDKACKLFSVAKRHLRQAEPAEKCRFYNAYMLYSYQYENNLDATLQNIDNALALLGKIDDVSLKITVYNSQGVVLLGTQNTGKAQKCFNNAYKLILEQRESIRSFYLPVAYNNLALCCQIKGDLKQAKRYLLKGVSESRNTEIEGVHLSILYDNLGDTCLLEKDFVNARKYFMSSLEICRKNRAIWDMAYPLVNLAKLNLLNGEISSAMKDIHDVVNFCDRFNSKRNIVHALRLAVAGYVKKGDPFNAVFYYKRLRNEEKKGNTAIDVAELLQIDKDLQKLAKRRPGFGNVNSYELLLAASRRFCAYDNLAELLDFILEITTGFLFSEKGLVLLFRRNRPVFTVSKNIATNNGIPVPPAIMATIEKARESGESVWGASGLCIPIILKSRNSCVIFIEKPGKHRAMPHEMLDLFIAIADSASPVIDTLTLLEDVKEMNVELRRDVAMHSEKLKAIDALFRKDKLELVKQYSFGDIIMGYSTKMRDAVSLIERVAVTNIPVMLSGETGSGKSLLAKLIHHLSPRNQHAFIAQNCAAIPQGLIESELFGYVKGSFTGAISNKNGLFTAANDGTLFLDEIGIMSMDTQVKILRALEDNEIRPVGSVAGIKINVRLVCATNESIQRLIDENKFRQDLYYRLNVVEIRLPALRERREDIHVFLNYFVNKMAVENKTAPLRISKQAMSRLLDYQWPGNVRELENEIRRLHVVSSGKDIQLEDLPEHVRSGRITAGQEQSACLMNLPFRKAQKTFERDFIVSKLREHDWNCTKTAKSMGIFRQQLARMMISHKIFK